MGPAMESDFDDQPRLRPFRGACAGLVLWQTAERRLVGAQRLQPFPQVARNLMGIAGTDTAGILQLAAVVVTENEGADRLGINGRWRIAGDDELLPVGAFGLDPVAVASGPVGRAGALRHNAFER